MQLKCIFDVEKSEEITTRYREIYANLKEKYGCGEHKSFDKYSGLFEDYKSRSQYARMIHTGKVKEGIELTELELSMVCDDGYSHFGGSSCIQSDRTFKVEICTD